MAVVILQTLPNVDRTKFGLLIAALLEQGPLPADVCLFHASGPKGDDWRVCDIWESHEHWARFSQQRQAAARQRAGALEAIIEEFPVEATFAAEGWPS